jgi:gliding motility-associatede transport system auxiliary component
VNHTPRAKWQLRFANAIFVVLFLVAIGLLQWASREFHWQVDLTQNQRYSLSPASVTAIERLKGPVTVTGYASKRGRTRQLIRQVIGRYQKFKPDLKLEFVDPDTEPERVRSAGIQFEGEIAIAYGDARETIPPSSLSEESLTNAFTRLGHRGERWLVFLTGHGERSPERQANFDLSTWAAQLGKRGFKTRTLALGETPKIPQNTTALVIAGPRTDLLPGEIKTIDEYVEHGGNLLWLADPGPLHGLEPLGELLGVELQPGVIVDPASQLLAGDPTALVITNYGAQPIVRDFHQSTVFPQAAGLSLKLSKGWKSDVLLDTSGSAWSEVGPLNGEVHLDKGKDIPGPLLVGAALTREVDGREQRVVVIGDGDFLSNSVIGNGGNLELGMSIANWLSHDEAYVNIPVRTARDRGLRLTGNEQIAIGSTFLVFLPLALIGGGIGIWWRRRRR